MTSRVQFGMIDNSGEDTGVGIYFPQVTSANYDAIVDDSITGAVGRVRIAIAAISTANEVKRTVTAEIFNSAGTIPADPYAQRERGLLVRYTDTVTNKRAVITIPSPDMGSLAQTGTDVVDHVNNITAAAFVTAFELDAVSAAGNPVSVLAMSIVGRNN